MNEGPQPDEARASEALVARKIAYRIPDSSTTILNGVDLTVSAGESVAIVGRSGAGKSTLLAILGLMLKPDSGTLTVLGRNAIGLNDVDAAALRRQGIGFVLQKPTLITSRPVDMNVGLAFGAGGDAPSAPARIAEALAAVGLADRAHSMPTELSGGEQQRVAIARALVSRPTIIFADEPTGSLDVDTASDVLDNLLDTATAAGTAVVVVTHDHEVAERCHRQLVLASGVLT